VLQGVQGEGKPSFSFKFEIFYSGSNLPVAHSEVTVAFPMPQTEYKLNLKAQNSRATWGYCINTNVNTDHTSISIK
jgi:hypothetical protein